MRSWLLLRLLVGLGERTWSKRRLDWLPRAFPRACVFVDGFSGDDIESCHCFDWLITVSYKKFTCSFYMMHHDWITLQRTRRQFLIVQRTGTRLKFESVLRQTVHTDRQWWAGQTEASAGRQKTKYWFIRPKESQNLTSVIVILMYSLTKSKSSRWHQIAQYLRRDNTGELQFNKGRERIIIDDVSISPKADNKPERWGRWRFRFARYF